MKGKQYDEEFKKKIVELYNNKKTACEIIREYGISSSALYKWIKEYICNSFIDKRFSNFLFFSCKKIFKVTIVII